FQHKAGHADDAVHGRTDFVTHIRHTNWERDAVARSAMSFAARSRSEAQTSMPHIAANAIRPLNWITWRRRAVVRYSSRRFSLVELDCQRKAIDANVPSCSIWPIAVRMALAAATAPRFFRVA